MLTVLNLARKSTALKYEKIAFEKFQRSLKGPMQLPPPPPPVHKGEWGGGRNFIQIILTLCFRKFSAFEIQRLCSL
jgi:hypothetical protein